ncbi:MAG TPA: ATP-binding protein [Terriglobales bacterium]
MKHSFAFRPRPLTGPTALVLTLAANVAAALLSLVAIRWTNYSTPFMVFTGAVIVCAWITGFRNGALTAVVGALFANYYLMHPEPGWSLSWADLSRTLLWVAFASGLAFLLARLRSSQDKAERVLASIGEGFCVMDRDWRVVYINGPGAQLMGRKKNEVIGQSYWDLTPESKGTIIEPQLRRSAAEGVPVEFEARSGQQSRWLQIRACPFAEGLSIFFQDITAAKEREETLRSVLERLTRAHKAAEVGAFEWNLSTNELIWSEDALRIHGLSREQFDGRFETWVKTIHPDDLTTVLTRIQKSLDDKSEYSVEYRTLIPTGQLRWFGVHGRVMLDDHGKACGMAGLCSDITQRKLEEAALRRSEKLATAGRLAATIAHEINNPLEAVTNLIYLLRREHDLKPDSKEMLRLAEEQLARVNHIAKQTLGFYRDRNVPEAVDVVQTLEELLAILRARIASKQITILREYENACLLDGFRGELRQVFSNLLTNAIDASPRGGKLIVRVKPQRAAEHISSVHVEVEDFGSGIQHADQEHIFEPFFTTKSDIGTGLGLWVTKELVEKHGGSIVFRSNCQNGNSGTCFSVTLPGPGNSAHTAPPLPASLRRNAPDPPG